MRCIDATHFTGNPGVWGTRRFVTGERLESSTSGAKALMAVAFYGPAKAVS